MDKGRSIAVRLEEVVYILTNQETPPAWWTEPRPDKDRRALNNTRWTEANESSPWISIKLSEMKEKLYIELKREVAACKTEKLHVYVAKSHLTKQIFIYV